MTEKLFYQDSHLAQFEAEVVSCIAGKSGYEIELDRTAFFPEGGGQYADTGRLGEVCVKDVQERDGSVVHLTDGPLDPGTHVTGRLNWEERFIKMQQHSGEHIVSGLVHARFGYNNVGFHLGTEDCTMDFDGILTGDELMQIEQEANRAVWKNLEIQTVYPAADELKELKYRSKREIDGQVRIVIVPGYDVCACCAPHVKRTGEIGLIKLTHMQRYKGGVRVTMLCGARALADYEIKQEQARTVSALLCAKVNETAVAVSQLKDEYNALKYAAAGMEKKLVRCHAAMIPKNEEPVCIFTDDLEGESMRGLMNLVLEDGHILCAVFHGNGADGYRYVMGSRSVDMWALVKEFNAAFAGRGGGRAEMVQGTAKGDPEAVRDWIIRKAGEL